MSDFVIENGVLKKYKGWEGYLTIPEGVTRIGDRAFAERISLLSVTIPEGVTSIGSYAFDSCYSLTKVTIPKSVTNIGDRAFYECGSLTSVTIPEGVTSIGEQAFFECSSLKSVTIPEGVTRIGGSAFARCTKLTSVTIPDSVTDIGVGAFQRCPGLQDEQGLVIVHGVLYDCMKKDVTNVTIPEDVTSIEDNVFSECRSLTSVAIPKSVTNIGNQAFYNCSKLTGVTIPEGVTNIGERAFFECSSLKSVTIPESVTRIGERAFFECSSLKSVTISESVTDIGVGAFRSCPRLQDEQGLVIVHGVLYDCMKKDVTNVTIPEGVTSIEDRAFYKCSHLTSVAIPKSVTSIGEYAFFGCSSLTNISLPSSLTDVGLSAFTGCSGLRDEQGLVIVHGVLYDCVDKDIASVTIPDGVTNIDNHAFDSCYSLRSVAIPEGVTSIADRAFYKCSNLTSVTIPKSVISIGEQAFFDCSSLKSVTIPDGVTSIGEKAFYGCSGLTSVTTTDSGVGKNARGQKNETIPGSVTGIGDNAFSWCYNLRSVTIPKSVTSIGEAVFYQCGALTQITLPEGVTRVRSNAFAECQELNELVILGKKLTLSAQVFDNEFPAGLVKNLKDLYPHLADGALKDFVLNKKVWNQLSPELQREIFMTRQSNVLSSSYTQCVNAEQAEAFGRDLLELLGKKPSAKECNTAASFMAMFFGPAHRELMQKLYAALKEAENGAKAVQLVEDNAPLMKLLSSPVEVDENLPVAEKMVFQRLVEEQISVQGLEDKLKSYYGITFKDLDARNNLQHKDGSKVASYVLAWLLMAHESQREATPPDIPEIEAAYRIPAVRPEAAKILDELKPKSVQNTLLKIAHEYLGGYKVKRGSFLAYPICRYANEYAMSILCRNAAANDASPLRIFREAALFNNTREALLFANKYKELNSYASIRGVDANILWATEIAEFGLDEHGQKNYDLGNSTVTVTLNEDLTLSLYDNTAGKTVKSIPKRNSDPEKYKTVCADFSEMSKNVKKAAKDQSDAALNAFLNGKTYNTDIWSAVFLKNPVLNMVARLLVWQQDDRTFTVAATSPIDSDGKVCSLTNAPIALAHPMDMKADEVAAWQNYFVSHGLKQPFDQVWEPVIAPETIRPDRYTGTEVSVFQFKHREKHGIYFSEVGDIGFRLAGCSLKYQRTMGNRHELTQDETFTLGEFKFKQYTRQVNHIVALLDRWTVAGRILKDDVTVRRFLDNFTAAQIMEFIRLTTENNCTNCAAMLLEYKQEHYPDFDPMAEFTLE